MPVKPYFAANHRIGNWAMTDIFVTFKLTGWHAQHFRQMLRIVNLAPGRPIDESEMAESLIRAMLDDDARDHDERCVRIN
jgi:hypothetical protein